MIVDEERKQSCCGSSGCCGSVSFEAVPARRRDAASRKTPLRVREWRSVAIGLCGVLTIAALVVQWSGVNAEAVRIGLFASAIVAGGWFIFPKAVRSARRRAPDMNLLMTLAVLGAALLGEWAEAASVVFLFGLAELLEAFSVHRARRAIESLMEIAPATAQVKRGDDWKEMPVERVVIDDIVRIRSGARVPLDGEVVAGHSSIDQAPITGESLPVEKGVGDGVFAGTINGEGSLQVRVSKSADDSTLARIIHLIEEAQRQKAPSQRFVDTFAKYYTPAVMVLALLVFLLPPLWMQESWGTWFYRALVLLVVACPCALVISTPVSIVSGLTALARRGVLVKGGAFLETVGKLRALALDKTGTVTEGKPRVNRVIAFNGVSESEIVRLAAAIDVHSEHPIARAVVRHAREAGVEIPPGEKYRASPGRGAEACVEGHDYFVGNHRFAHDCGVCSPEIEEVLGEIEKRGESVVIVGHKRHGACRGEVVGILAVGDTVRENAAAAIRSIREAGVRPIVMLSGDHSTTVNRIAAEVGVDDAIGDLLPDEKIARVRQLLEKHGSVGMIGDGVNDAPAMAAATLGIAMGAVGTDTAVETADIALMEDDLEKVAEAIQLGRRTLRTIQWNIGFAIVVKVVFLILAMAGHTTLWLAIVADTGATLVVIANSLRLLRSPHKNLTVTQTGGTFIPFKRLQKE